MSAPVDDATCEATEAVNARIRAGEIFPVHMRASRRADSGWHFQDRVSGQLVRYEDWRDLFECRLPERSAPSITCPQCGMTSYHPADVANTYCGNCHQFHDEMEGRRATGDT